MFRSKLENHRAAAGRANERKREKEREIERRTEIAIELTSTARGRERDGKRRNASGSADDDERNEERERGEKERARVAIGEILSAAEVTPFNDWESAFAAAAAADVAASSSCSSSSRIVRRWKFCICLFALVKVPLLLAQKRNIYRSIGGCAGLVYFFLEYIVAHLYLHIQRAGRGGGVLYWPRILLEKLFKGKAFSIIYETCL